MEPSKNLGKTGVKARKAAIRQGARTAKGCKEG